MEFTRSAISQNTYTPLQKSGLKCLCANTHLQPEALYSVKKPTRDSSHFQRKS